MSLNFIFKVSRNVRPQQNDPVYGSEYWNPDKTPKKAGLEFNFEIDFHTLFLECDRNMEKFVVELMGICSSSIIIKWQNNNRKKFSYLLDRIAKGNTTVPYTVSKIRPTAEKKFTVDELFSEVVRSGDANAIESMIAAVKQTGNGKAIQLLESLMGTTTPESKPDSKPESKPESKK